MSGAVFPVRVVLLVYLVRSGTAAIPYQVVLWLWCYRCPAILSHPQFSLPQFNLPETLLLRCLLHLHIRQPARACPLSPPSSKPPFPPFSVCPRVLEIAGPGCSVSASHQWWKIRPTSTTGPRSSCCSIVCLLVQLLDIACAGERS